MKCTSALGVLPEQGRQADRQPPVSLRERTGRQVVAPPRSQVLADVERQVVRWKMLVNTFVRLAHIRIDTGKFACRDISWEASSDTGRTCLPSRLSRVRAP